MPQIAAGTKSFRVANPYGGDSINADIYSGLNVALQSSGVVNPLLEVENTWDKRKSIEFRTVGSVFAEVNFLKNFTWRSTMYADMSNVNTRQYSPLYYAYNPMTNLPYLYGDKTQVSENDDSYKKYQQDHILTFKKGFGDHNLTATAGFTTYYSVLLKELQWLSLLHREMHCQYLMIRDFGTSVPSSTIRKIPQQVPAR